MNSKFATLSEIRAWAALAEKATPGPWEESPQHTNDKGFVVQVIHSQTTKGRVGEIYGGTMLSEPKANALLMGVSREAIPHMAATVERLQEAGRELRLAFISGDADREGEALAQMESLLDQLDGKEKG